jgi:predicted O-linked N-acetylglucosamine transferase (SPINDLY family)
MAQSETESLFQSALRHHQAGELTEAQTLYRQVIARKSDHAGAAHYLGVIAYQSGDLQNAVDLIRRAIALRPDYAEAYNNLAAALRDLGKTDEAITAARRAIQLKPDYPEAHNTLANALRNQGHLQEAIAAYRKAIELKPDSAQAYNNLGNALRDLGQGDEAAAAYRRAIELQPAFPQAQNNLGDVLREMGKVREAVAAYRHALALQPDYPQAWNNLGIALRSLGQTAEAIAAFGRAIALRAGFAEAYNNLGIALRDAGKLDESIADCRRAIALRPDFAEAYVNLGIALRVQGESTEAIAAYRHAMELKRDYTLAHSNLVYAMHFDPEYNARAIAEEHTRWNHQHAAPLKNLVKPHTNDRDPDRRLRIGYVSPDFREHPVGRFLAPLLAHHDKTQVEVFACSDVVVPDEMTGRLRSHVDAWREIVGFSDERAAELIRQDRIDILIDLTMHMAANRLLVFARKPAPVQATYLAYCSSTGLEAIDYRLSDPFMDPPGMDETVYSERTIRLPQSYWCYDPIIGDSEIGPLPALNNGFVTFGSLNNFCKVSEPTLAAWIEILRIVPDSRLLLHANEGSHRQRIRDRLQREGIDPTRLRFASFMPTQRYFELYRLIDVGLDTFPYGGGTTTCDALWMGVPVVSLAGQTGVGRGGVSILSNIGLTELVADSPKKYVQIARELTANLEHLNQMRGALRRRMRQSPLMDAPRFARDVETAYRRMWVEAVGSK